MCVFNLKRIIASAIFCCVASLLPAFAAGDGEEAAITERFTIRYRLNKAEIDMDYLDNQVQIAHIRNYLHNSPRIDSITIISYSSPEGTYARNAWLTKHRGIAARDFLLKECGNTDKLRSDMIKFSPLVENWEGLTQMVDSAYTRPDREKVLEILRDETIGDETRKTQLKRLDRGRSWEYLKKEYMPMLRAATWICVWAQVLPPLPEHQNITDTLKQTFLPIITPERVHEPLIIETKKTLFAAKTNLLYDAGTALNYAFEFPIGDKFSLQLQQHTPWWVSRDNRRCLEFLSLGAEFRWWFAPQYRDIRLGDRRRDVLAGHFLGAHVWSGDGDLQWDRHICQQFTFWSAGLTYGYAMPIGKLFNLEFTISAGYASIPYQHYNPTDDWQILIKDNLNAGRMHYFGPTKAEISFVIPITSKSKYQIR